MFNQATSSGINASANITESAVTTLSLQAGNATNVSKKDFEAAERHVTQILEKTIIISAELEKAQVEILKIDVGNITTAVLMLQSNTPLFDNSNTTGKINWNFSGENQLFTVTLRIGDRTWQEVFTRLRLPTSALLLGRAELKPKAHQKIYEGLYNALEPISRLEKSKVVIIQGTSGLGKTYCAQHYFYHQASQRHQMIAWLTGTTKEAFLHGWQALAQQLRNMQASNEPMNDDMIIQDWCENKLGRWLFIIDEVTIDAAWLKERLPKNGGHIVITTHFFDYQLHKEQRILQFLPLSIEDAQILLQIYMGDYWQSTGYLKEQDAINYLFSALGGFPVALTQMALLAHKKIFLLNA